MSAPIDETARSDANSSVGTRNAVRQLASALAADIARAARRARPRIRHSLMLIKLLLLAGIAVLVAAGGAMLWVLHDTGLEVKAAHVSPSVLIEAADGRPLGRVGAFGDQVPRESMPNILVNAVLSIEDRRFYSHWGVDPRSVVRAANANWVAGAIAEGGSTITQQLAKMQYVGNERSYTRKFREAFLSLWLETRLSKDEILTRYLNSVYLGAGAYGMAAAARNYFNKDLQALTLSEAAMLAGLIQAPSRFNPMTNPEAAQQRAAVVLDAMVDAKAIGPAQAAAAKATPAIVRSSPRTVPAETWFADWIAQHEFAKVAGTTSRPMRVRTTLDRRVQAVAERVVNNALDRSGASLGVSQAALVAMRPNGAVVAMVGGRDYKDSQFNRAVDARRQPGSAFKLFVFYAALRNGYSINDVIDASPIEIKSWRPENYGGQRYGRLSLEDAFAYSVNTAAIRLALDVGLDNVVAAARELGLTAPLAEVPSMALGTNEVSLLDLTGAFASIRAGRARLEPWGIAAFGPEGSGLRQLSPPVGITQELTHQQEMNELLERVVTSGTGRGAALSDGSAAGKTGTSQDYRDAWFIGYSRDLVVGVWVGNDDRTPMHRVTGGSLPATIWRDFMTAATPILGQPDDAVADAVAAPSDGPATPACDVKACSTAYSSFRSSDCTYQPYSGPRRLCEWRFDPSSSIPRIARAAAASGSCDADACGRRFRSFDSATCTYQPYGGGPRAICDIKAAE